MSTSKDSQYALLTSTRYDPFLLSITWNNDSEGPSPFLLLPYHHDRILLGAEQHNWRHATSHLTYTALKAACFQAVNLHNCMSMDPKQAYKVRVTVSQDGELIVDAQPVDRLSADPTTIPTPSSFEGVDGEHWPRVLPICVDFQPSETSIFTATKTTERAVYDKARARNNIPDPSGHFVDVLLYNQDNKVMETSIFNIALYRAPYWITPPASTGCLPGVFRRWLLEQDLIQVDEEGDLSVDRLMAGSFVLLFNSVRGCVIGRVQERVLSSGIEYSTSPD